VRSLPSRRSPVTAICPAWSRASTGRAGDRHEPLRSRRHGGASWSRAAASRPGPRRGDPPDTSHRWSPACGRGRRSVAACPERGQCNLLQLLEKYESRLTATPLGKRYQDCSTRQPPAPRGPDAYTQARADLCRDGPAVQRPGPSMVMFPLGRERAHTHVTGDRSDEQGQLHAPEGADVIRTIDVHAAGEPLRVIVDGLRQSRAPACWRSAATHRASRHSARRLMWEPRGHADMYGAIPTEPVRDGSDCGVLFLHNEGFSTMCGHGIIGLTKVLLEAGMVAASAARRPSAWTRRRTRRGARGREKRTVHKSPSRTCLRSSTSGASGRPGRHRRDRL